MAASAVSASLGAGYRIPHDLFGESPDSYAPLEGCGLAADRVDVVVVGQVLVGQQGFRGPLRLGAVGEHAHVKASTV